MVLDFKDNVWHPLALTECVSLIHPVIIRERDDKITDGTDVRISQIESFMDSNQTEEKVQKLLLPNSKIVDRKFWTKDGKNGKSIRKIITLQTFKSKLWSGCPEWIVFYSDYSQGRKSPLDRKLKTARTKEEADEIAKNLIDSNIKKGWAIKN